MKFYNSFFDVLRVLAATAKSHCPRFDNHSNLAPSSYRTQPIAPLRRHKVLGRLVLLKQNQ